MVKNLELSKRSISRIITNGYGVVRIFGQIKKIFQDYQQTKISEKKYRKYSCFKTNQDYTIISPNNGEKY